MDSYHNKIKSIQETINDIKHDLDSIKGVRIKLINILETR